MTEDGSQRTIINRESIKLYKFKRKIMNIRKYVDVI